MPGPRASRGDTIAVAALAATAVLLNRRRNTAPAAPRQLPAPADTRRGYQGVTLIEMITALMCLPVAAFVFQMGRLMFDVTGDTYRLSTGGYLATGFATGAVAMVAAILIGATIAAIRGHAPVVVLAAQPLVAALFLTAAIWAGITVARPPEPQLVAGSYATEHNLTLDAIVTDTGGTSTATYLDGDDTCTATIRTDGHATTLTSNCDDPN